MNLKKVTIIWIAIATLIFSLTGCGLVEDANKETSENAENNEVEISYDYNAKFSYNDLVVEKLKYGMTEDEVKKIMGNPDRKTENNGNQDLYGESVDYYYGDLQLSFYRHNGKMVLSLAYTKSPEYAFSKGLKVGVSKDEVIKSFYNESTNENELRGVYSIYSKNNAFGKYLYGHGLEDVTDGEKQSGNVEFAYINKFSYDSSKPDATYMIEYHYSEPPYILDYAGSNDELGTLIFDVNNKDIVTGIRWYFYPRIDN